MRVLICDSNNWFSLQEQIKTKYEIKVVSNKEDLTLKSLKSFRPEFVFFVHWNWIVDKDIYENYECIVFHTAPLPYGRGGSPIQNLILEGFDTSPVCALKMTGELDAGPVYSQVEVNLSGTLTLIFSRICDAINQLIIEIIDKRPYPKEQKGKAYIFKRLNKTDNEIPKGLSLKKIYDRVRMLDHEDYPNAYILYGDARIEFLNADLNEESLVLTCKITTSS